nr:hypothetical protein Iba_chr02bCG8620 [Ipomoea batatas]
MQNKRAKGKSSGRQLPRDPTAKVPRQICTSSSVPLDFENPILLFPLQPRILETVYKRRTRAQGSGGCDEGIMRIAELVSPKTNSDWADAREMSLQTDNLCHRKETRCRSKEERDQQPMKHGHGTPSAVIATSPAIAHDVGNGIHQRKNIAA